MVPRIPTLACAIAVVVAGSSGNLASAQSGTRSPFLPPQASGPAAPTQGAPLEYRGYMVTSEGTQYRLYDPAKKAGTWVKLNERNPDFEVVAKQFDRDRNTLVIEHQGRTLTLAERESKIVSAGNAASALPQPVQPPAAAPAINVAPAVTQTVVVNPSPADEQKRLEAVASEVARRRALREQATQQVGQPQPAMPQPGVPPGARPVAPNTLPGNPTPLNNPNQPIRR